MGHLKDGKISLLVCKQRKMFCLNFESVSSPRLLLGCPRLSNYLADYVILEAL